MTDVILRISGMDCGACAVRIVRALQGLPGLREVSVSDTAGCACLTYDEMAVDLGEIARRVQRAGFDVPVGMAELRCPGADAGAEARLRAVFGVRSVARAGDTFTVTLWPVGTDAAALPAVLGPGTELTAQHGGEETLQGRARQRLARGLGLGVLLTALMLWRLPVFVQLVLAAAVLFGVGAALWRSTWRALRGGSLGPDAPGLLAALILFAYSAYAAFAGLQPCFPALCGIACAQLAGKCAAQLVRGTLAAPVQRLRHLRPRTATVVRDGVQAQTDAGTLTPQDVVHILPGERIPVDGIVRSGVCTIDESALTGAPRPVEKTVGDAVLAGTLDRAGSASVTPTAVGDVTVLQRTIAALQRAQTVRTPEQERLERAASRMTALLIILAAGVGAVWLFRRQPGDLTRALTCACGVLAAACPGAAGQAAGVAALAGIGRAAERGELLMHGAHRAPVWLAAADVPCRVSAAGCVRGDRPGRGGGARVRRIRRRAAVCAARKRNEGGAAMTTAVLELNVSGMICRACEDAIADALLHTRGVISAQAHYWRSRVTITYDPDIVTEDTLRQVLTNAGYPPGAHGMGGVVVDLICLALVGVLYWGLPKLLMLVQVPALAENASLGLVFLVGLLTSTHCIGMCGGILLAQTTDAHGVTGHSKRGLIASAAYNGGRVVSYTAVGAVCGALGAVITYTPNIKSMVFTVAGALVLLIGLRMAGILPGLRPSETELPGACSLNARTRRRFAGQPLIIGLLTGVMPCGALSAMWLYAMSSGSAVRGALVMLVFSLGTVPLLFLFGALQSFLPRGWMKYIVKGSAVLVVTLGLSMLVKGIRLFGM